MKSLTFDSNLPFIDLATSLRKQFKMREIALPEINQIAAYAILCDAHSDDGDNYVYTCLIREGAESKNTICVILAALYCFVPHDMGKATMAEFGVEIACT